MAGRRGGAVFAHVQTWRPYTLWYVGLLGLGGAGLAGAGSGSGGLPWPRLLAAWAAPTVGWVGGHYLGDYFDRRLDALSKPHRPIPSGRLRAGTALACGVGCLGAVIVLAAAGGWATALVAALAVGGIVAYGGWLKSRGLAGNLVRGALGGLVLLYGAAAVWPASPHAGTAVIRPLAAFVIAFWAHDTASNLVGTLRDEAGDRAGGYRTVPVRRGGRTAIRTAVLFYCLAGAAALAGGFAAQAALGRGLGGFLLLLAVSVALGGSALLTALGGRAVVTARGALRAHELLVLGRIFLAGAVLVPGFGLVPALALAVPSLVATWWTQQRMRVAHEFGGPAVVRPGEELMRSTEQSDAG